MSTKPRSLSKTRWEEEPMYEKGASVQLICNWGLSPNSVAQGTQGVVVKHVNSQTHQGWIYTINIGKGNNIRYVGPISEEFLAPL